jgi:hypothetical protein
LVVKQGVGFQGYSVPGGGIQSVEVKRFGSYGAYKQSGDWKCESRIVVGDKRLVEEK